MPVLGQRLVPALMVAGFAATAGAQQKACEIDEGTPQQVTRAMLDLQIAQQSAKPDDAAKKLQDAMKLLNEGDMKQQPGGSRVRDGAARSSCSRRSPACQNGIDDARRAWVCRRTRRQRTIIFAGIDSAFTIVEASNPDCASQTAPWRQQKPWVDLVNQRDRVGQRRQDGLGGLSRESLAALARTRHTGTTCSR